MKNNLTAVEWFFKWQNDNFEATVVEEIVAYETAKAMEKEQVKRMYTEEEVYDLLVEWNMYQKGEPRVDEDEIPNGFMSFNEWFKKISKQQEK
jgi:hypothetical protein